MNTTLQTLNISHNKISDDGAIAISEGLKDNSTLQNSTCHIIEYLIMELLILVKLCSQIQFYKY